MEYQKPKTYYQSKTNDFVLAHGDCFKLLKEFDFKFDMIFADPPYFLSNGGISLQSGKVVCVDKCHFKDRACCNASYGGDAIASYNFCVMACFLSKLFLSLQNIICKNDFYFNFYTDNKVESLTKLKTRKLWH